ncbi:MAG: phosphotransferase, partial [Actinomycetota bacterium]|nr:phosphotransferase [Actinomycetota bacterium]
AATVAWCVFNLQDAALTGLGAATIVPIENGVYGIAKIVLLVGLASASPHWGIYGSWNAGLLFSLILVNALIFGRLLRPRAERADGTHAPTRSEIVGFAAPDFVGALLWLAATTLMPVLVIGIAGPSSNAYFSLAWMIAVPLLAISTSTGAAFVVSAARDSAQTGEYARGVLRQTLWLVLPAATVTAVAAPYVLRLFGRPYADHAVGTLALLALSAIPNTLTTLYVRIYRVQGRMRAVIGLLAAQCGLVLTLAPVLLSAIGIAGVGWAWLISQVIVAVAVTWLDPGALWPRGRGGMLAAAGIGRTARLRRRNAAALAGCAGEGIKLEAVEPTINDIAVGRGVDGHGQAIVIKLAVSDAGARSLQRAVKVLSSLAEDPRLACWETPYPAILSRGELDRRSFVVESALVGESAATLLDGGADLDSVLAAALDAIEGLHRLTARKATITSELLDDWLDRRALAIEAVLSPRRAAVLRRTVAALRTELDGRTVTLARGHGDFVPENVLLDPDSLRVSGIVDWELSGEAVMPAIDATMFTLAARSRAAHCELGASVASALMNNPDYLRPGDGVPAPTLVMICWLAHIAANLTKSERYGRNLVWKRRNVYRVLDSLAAR